MPTKFNVGDTVKVTDGGRVFCYYEDQAEVMGLDYFYKGFNPCHNIEYIGEIVSIEKHMLREDTILAGVRNEERKEDIIVDITAIELVHKTDILNNDNFII